MDELRAAVESGLVSVSPRGRGFLVTGAVNDMLVLPDLEALEAVWMPKQQGYFIENAEASRELERLERRSSAVSAAVATRRAQAAKDGAKLFDAERAKRQRQMTRELRDVYQTALDEHKDELQRVLARYEAAEDPVEAIKLAYRRDELESVIESLTSGLADAGRAAEALTNTRLADAAAISRDIASWQLDNMAGFRVSRFIANDTASLAITGAGTYHGKYDLKAWQGVADKRKARQIIKQSVSRGLLTGEHPGEVAKRLEGLFTGDTPLSPYKRAARIAQTEMHSVMNQAALETMAEANAGGLKMRKRWDATLDGSTRKDHRKVDGETVDIDKPFSNGLMRPGDGGAADRINCRCALVEVLEGFEPDAKLRRDNVTGETIPYMTYEEWANEQGSSNTLLEENREKKTAPKPLRKPERPRKADYNSPEEFEAARAEYRQKKAEYEKSIDEAVSYHLQKEKRYASREAVQKWADENGIKIEDGVLETVDLRVMDDVISVQNDMMKKYPQVFEVMDYRIKLSNDKGLFMEGGSGLLLNESIFTDYETVLRECFDNMTSGYTVFGDGTFRTQLRHEFGHNLDSVITDRFVGSDGHISDFGRLGAYRKELREIAEAHGSEYANLNEIEAFAEGFAAYTSSPDSAYGKAFGEFLDKWL